MSQCLICGCGGEFSYDLGYCDACSMELQGMKGSWLNLSNKWGTYRAFNQEVSERYLATKKATILSIEQARKWEKEIKGLMKTKSRKRWVYYRARHEDCGCRAEWFFKSGRFEGMNHVWILGKEHWVSSDTLAVMKSILRQISKLNNITEENEKWQKLLQQVN
jgi:hypothetical protein